MKILCLSDTHGFLPELDLNGIDLVVHCGDMTFENRNDFAQQLHFYMEKFRPWGEKIADKVKGQFKFTWGNHEMFAQTHGFYPDCDFTKYHCLHDNFDIVLDKDEKEYKIYGTAHQPVFCWWAFNDNDDEQGLGRKYSFIPNDTDILITHSPPYSILDLTGDRELAGSRELLYKLDSLKHLKLHCFGHIHHSYGTWESNCKIVKTFVNSSICNETYKPVNKPIVVKI